MTAGDHLNGMQFKHTEDEYLHHLQAGEHGELGVMHWHKDHGPRFNGERQFAPGEVSGILVPKQHQRQGIGSALFAQAQKYDPPAVHSINQSPESRPGPSAYRTGRRARERRTTPDEQQFFHTSLAEHQPGDLTDGARRGRMQKLTDHGGPK